tara:strand:+ start:2435 stop:3382 length:948 start_codon:yes stop_codon:yes gene_type:complete
MKLIIFFIVNICFATDAHLVLKTKLRQFTYEAYGKLKPQQMSKVASKVHGQVINRYVKIGQLITKGQTLFQLDPGTLPLEIRQIEFEIEKQQLQLAHHQGRYNRRTKNPDAYTEEGLELEKLQLDKIKLEIKKLNTQKSIHQLRLDYKTIKAPFDGVITELLKEIGDWVMLGGSTLTMQSFNVWRLETEVPWDVYSQVQIGDVVIVRKAGIKHKVEVMAKIPVYNPKTGQFRLELDFTSEKWKPSKFEIVPLIFSIKKSQLEIPMRFVKKELGTYQVKTVEPEGSRWLSVEGVSQDGFFYPINLDLENLTLQSLF